jgi:polysaccharide export outer membrane protein
MRSLCEGVFSFLPCLSMNRLLIGCLAIAVAFSYAPAAPSQDSASSSGQTGATTPSDPQVTTASATNDRISQLALTGAVSNGDYVLNSGDLLGIEIFDVPELSREVRVSESGLISLPLLPVRVRAAGLTAFQLQDKLAELLEANGLVTHPQVTISVKEQHGQPITVTGAVKTPMVIQAVREMNLLEVLARAGGLAEDAAGQILVTHAPTTDPQTDETDAAAASEPAANADPAETTETSTTDSATPPESSASSESPTVRVSLSDLLDTGDPQYNLVLHGGDVVSVPRAGVVYAVGAVRSPGGFVMANDRQQLTVLKVLALAGGLAPTAKAKDAVIIRQSAESDKRQVPVNLERILAFKAEDPLLLQSDILFVPNSTGKQVMGRVAQTALGLAGGVALVRLGR